MATRSPREQNAEILAALNVLDEYRALGVEIIGEPRASGMVACRAFGREDRRPSAWVNAKTGFYGDAGGKDAAAYTMSLFDFAVKVGRFPDWKEARKAYAAKAGVDLGRGRPAGAKDDWHNRLILQTWDTPGNDILTARWCLQHKPGVTVEAIKAAGGQMAYYPCHWDKESQSVQKNHNCRQVIAIPAYGEWLLDAEPVAWILWDITGAPFDVTPKGTPSTEPRVLAKMVSCGPTRGTVLGLSALMVLADPDRRAAVERVWKVEGPADMLTLWSAIPAELRETHLVITNGGGATSDVLPHQAKLLAGLPVAVCGDCDEAGQVGAAKWLRALDGLTADMRPVVLPWEIKPSHGEDVRDYLTGGKTYADLCGLLESSEPFRRPESQAGAADAAGATPGAPDSTAAGLSDEKIDRFTDEQIAKALQIDVLGRTPDGEIKVYSEAKKWTILISGVSRLKYEDLLMHFGTPVRKVVSRTNEDAAPGMFPIRDVREALAHLASYRMLGDESEIGLGCWPVIEPESGNNGEPSAIVLVNASEAAHFNGQFLRINHPRHGGHLLNFENGANPWYDFDRLAGLLEQAKDPAFRQRVADDLATLFSRWRWQGSNDTLLAAGLVLATWVQAAWAWRPRIDVLGESGTGKSMLCEALTGIFRDLVISTADTTFAGLAQEMQRHMAAVIVDEMDAKDKESKIRQRQIIKGLRSASRGTMRIRGTGGQKATKFTLRHLAWVAGISLNYDDQADRNRAVILHLKRPTAEMAGKLILPPAEQLQDLGQRSLAVALWAIQAARLMAVRLKDVKVAGAEQRQVESYAVPAAMVAVVMGMDDANAAGLLGAMLQDAKDDQPVEADQTTLVKEILGATVSLQTHRMTVGQAISYVTDTSHLTATNRDEWRTTLESGGIKLDLGVSHQIVFRYQAVKKLLRGTRWAEESIEQYLERLEGAIRTRRSVGGVKGRCMAFPLRQFVEAYIGDSAMDGDVAREF